MTTPAEQLATLRHMLAEAADRYDTRDQQAIDAEMRAEQAAEDRKHLRAHPSASDSEWAARRWAG